MRCLVGGANSTRVTDWSHEGRRKKSLVKAAGDIKQTCITQYYDIVDEIERLSHTNEVLSMLQRQSPDELPFRPVLKQIIMNAERNATVLPQAKRHPEVLKNFATALFIYARPLAYNFLQRNLHQPLPSLRTVQRIVHGNYDTLNEGEFRFDGLADHTAKHNTVNLVSVGEDATRIICRVAYDARTNRCVGFVLPLKDGLPEVDSFWLLLLMLLKRCLPIKQWQSMPMCIWLNHWIKIFLHFAWHVSEPVTNLPQMTCFLDGSI